jgi:hypothetical protein
MSIASYYPTNNNKLYINPNNNLIAFPIDRQQIPNSNKSLNTNHVLKAKEKDTLDTPLRKASTFEKIYRVKNLSWFCSICNVFCNSQLQFDMHMLSQKHEEVKERKSKSANNLNTNECEYSGKRKEILCNLCQEANSEINNNKTTVVPIESSYINNNNSEESRNIM